MKTERDTLFIGGTDVLSRDGLAIDIVSPATETVVGHAPLATTEDIDAAVAAAGAALASPEWRSYDGPARAGVLHRMAAHIRRAAGAVSGVVTLENGSPVRFSEASQVLSAAVIFDYYADLVESYAFTEERAGLLGTALLVGAPVGIVAAVTPWNYPLYLAATKIAPAIAAGATVVLKPSPETPLSSFVFAEAAVAAGLPAGVLNVVPADDIASAHLVAHRGVDKVSFTGSSATGARIAAMCAQRLARVGLELGGKSAAIVLDDADLDAVLPTLVALGIRNSGQVCLAQTRILAPRTSYDAVVDTVTDLARAAVVGDPADPATELGPLVSADQRAVVERYVSGARASGARVTTGGGRGGRDTGWYVEPAVLADVTRETPAFREEIFGPVVCVMPYDDETEAVAIANDSDYGLAGTVWTSDLDRGTAVAHQVRAGTVGVNGLQLDPAVPFGGFKASGYGRELGPEGLRAYLETQAIHLGPRNTPGLATEATS
ncbi:aldehyde dehydrogenase family protein [Saccharopolyspora shandongensis]|uniref:aldehyde dehydrogenase family protein n=1 Tax=Saccharopolyspora shandongensis TaxID=418495 RepID=UPI0033E6889E